MGMCSLCTTVTPPLTDISLELSVLGGASLYCDALLCFELEGPFHFRERHHSGWSCFVLLSLLPACVFSLDYSLLSTVPGRDSAVAVAGEAALRVRVRHTRLGFSSKERGSPMRWEYPSRVSERELSECDDDLIL